MSDDFDERSLVDELARHVHPTAIVERGRGVDFIVFGAGDLAIRLPRRPRAVAKLRTERALLDVLAPRFPRLVPQPADLEWRRGPADLERRRGPADLERPRGLQPADLERPRGPADLERPRGPADLERPRGPADLERPRGPADLERPRGLADLEPLFAYPWLPGASISDAPTATIVDDLARFLGALHAMTDLPMVVDPTPDTIVSRLQAIVRARFLASVPDDRRAIVEDACARHVTSAVVACPVHGDLAARNLLVERGRLSGVIDWSDSVISDPAIDFGAIAAWAGMPVVDELVAKTGRAGDHALRSRAEILGVLVTATER